LKLRANVIDPNAQAALLRAGRRRRQMVLRRWRATPSTGRPPRLNAYLQDDEYRAVARPTLIRSPAGAATYTRAGSLALTSVVLTCPTLRPWRRTTARS